MKLNVSQAILKADHLEKSGAIDSATAIYKALLKGLRLQPNDEKYWRKIFKRESATINVFALVLSTYTDDIEYCVKVLVHLLTSSPKDLIPQAAETVKASLLNNQDKDLLLLTIGKWTAPCLETRHRKNQLPPKSSKGNSKANYKEKITALKSIVAQNNVAEALILAEELTCENPSEISGWNILAHLHIKISNLPKAIECLEKVIQINPKDVAALSNIGAMLIDIGKQGEAMQYLKNAIAIDRSLIQAHINLGNALLLEGSARDAIQAFQTALSISPNTPEALIGLGKAHTLLGESNRAKNFFKKVGKLTSKNPDVHINLATFKFEQGEFESAIQSLKTALKYRQSDPNALTNLGKCYQELNRLEEARSSYEEALIVDAGYIEATYELGILFYKSDKLKNATHLLEGLDYKWSDRYVLKCLYLRGEKDKFSNLLDQSIASGNVNSMVGSLGSRAEARYRWKKPNLFCKKPLDYVDQTSLLKKCNFNELFVNTAHSILRSTAMRGHQGLLKNGLQTAGNIFTLEQGLMSPIEELIRSEIELYKEKHSKSEEGFLRNWPSKYTLYGWFISLKSGGRLDAHMHEMGWISASIYINIPPKKSVDSGNLVVCTEDAETFAGVGPEQKRSVDVKTGDICLFPSSLLHYTIPFDSSEDRVVLAFDVKPCD
ncbi:tetratricopeptide repeat protein [Gammaproteobacteria bacterium]|nr:tetratricopeptide repeat protein [Gammaproteobacteria bacterium]